MLLGPNWDDLPKVSEDPNPTASRKDRLRWMLLTAREELGDTDLGPRPISFREFGLGLLEGSASFGEAPRTGDGVAGSIRCCCC